MLISLNWLNELIDLNVVKVKDLFETLTLGGFEIENSYKLIISNKIDIILNISTTPNRSDTLSVKGIANEISSLTNTCFKISRYGKKTCEPETLIINSLLQIPDLNKKKKNYSIFFTIAVENLTSFYSPNWLKQKLLTLGIEPSNNILDIKNYILLETGYPFELYDLDKIQTALNTNIFQLSLNSEKLLDSFQTSNTFLSNLNSKVLVLKADEEILSIGGILVNKKFEYSNTTKSLLIEASIFSAKQIRQSSRTIGIRTERSSVYEKGLNSTNLIQSLCRFLYLLKNIDNEINIKIHTGGIFNKIKSTVINLEYKTIIQILGPVLNNKTNKFNKLLPLDICNYLTRLKFAFNFDKCNLTWQVNVSLERFDDIKREIDLIEEIARLHGFNNFPIVLPDIFKIGKEDFSYQIRKKITNHFLNDGFNEIITYSLINFSNNQEIVIINSLSKDYLALRSTLLQNLIKLKQENLNQTNLFLEAFEYGHVFINSKFFIPIESEQVAGIFGSVKLKTDWSSDGITLSWFEAKGKLEQLFNKLNLSVYWKGGLTKLYKKILHPYRTSKLCLTPGVVFGIFGQINPILANKLNISPNLYLFEFNLDIVKNDYKYKKLLDYKSYSLYPKVFKDLSFIISKHISFIKIKNLIFLIAPTILKSIDLLDQYNGNSVPNTMVSLCIQFTFQSDKKTLLTKEVEQIIENIKLVLIQELKSIFRS